MTGQQLFYVFVTLAIVGFSVVILCRMWEKPSKTLARMEIRLKELEALSQILQDAEAAYRNSFYTNALIAHARKIEALKARIAMFKGGCL